MTKGVEVLKNDIESMAEKGDVFIDAHLYEATKYQRPIIHFEDKASEAEFNQMQVAYEKVRLQFMPSRNLYITDPMQARKKNQIFSCCI